MKTKNNPSNARNRITTKPDVSTALERPEQRFVAEGCPNTDTGSTQSKAPRARRTMRP